MFKNLASVVCVFPKPPVICVFGCGLGTESQRERESGGPKRALGLPGHLPTGLSMKAQTARVTHIKATCLNAGHLVGASLMPRRVSGCQGCVTGSLPRTAPILCLREAVSMRSFARQHPPCY